MGWQFAGAIVVQSEQWHYSNPVPNSAKLLRLQSFNPPQSGRATFCLSLPDGQTAFKRFYAAEEAVLIDLPEPFTTFWRRVGLRGTRGLRGIWIVNVEFLN